MSKSANAETSRLLLTFLTFCIVYGGTPVPPELTDKSPCLTFRKSRPSLSAPFLIAASLCCVRVQAEYQAMLARKNFGGQNKQQQQNPNPLNGGGGGFGGGQQLSSVRTPAADVCAPGWPAAAVLRIFGDATAGNVQRETGAFALRRWNRRRKRTGRSSRRRSRRRRTRREPRRRRTDDPTKGCVSVLVGPNRREAPLSGATADVSVCLRAASSTRLAMPRATRRRSPFDPLAFAVFP